MGCEECSEHLLTVFNPESPRFTTGRDTQQVCSHPVLSTKCLAMEQQLAFWGILGHPPFNLFSTSSLFSLAALSVGSTGKCIFFTVSVNSCIWRKYQEAEFLL